MSNKLFSFPGGLRLGKHKTEITALPVRSAPIPERLVFPLQQYADGPAEPIVQIGDKVLKGQLIAKANGPANTPIHASSSGTVTAMTDFPIAHASGLKTRCIEIKTDQLDQWLTPKEHKNKHYLTTPPSEIIKTIHNAGIIGMGGAGFPSNIKLAAAKQHAIDTLILNGAECEPYVSCDDMLMQEKPEEIISGALIMMHALQAKRCIIALEDNKSDAFNQLLATLENNQHASKKIKLAKVPTIFPVGGEKQLIKLLVNTEIAMRDLPFQHGIIVHNVATATAVHNAIMEGRPLISRFLSVAGTTSKVRNMDVLIGTPVNTLLESCGVSLSSLNKIIMGGPMMGIALHSSSSPIIKTTFCIIIEAKNTIAAYAKQKTPLPCIRCGHCADVCPVQLLPQQLYWHSVAKEFNKAESYHLLDCIECGCCDYVCPSHLPLVQLFRFAKTEIRVQKQQKRHADETRQRYEMRVQRLERNKRERAARHKKKIEALSQQTAVLDSTK